MTDAVVLDAGALIALERRDRSMLADLKVLLARKIPVYVPSCVVAQVWRGTARQHEVAVLLASKCVRVVPMDDGAARRVGLLLGLTGTSDVIDAHVALLASVKDAMVFTSDPDDITALVPSAVIRRV